MKKLFNLKNWLTLKETAERLTSSLNEKVSITDCLQMAIDKHITISAILNEGRYAIISQQIKTTQRKDFSQFISRLTDEGAYIQFLDSERFVTNGELDYEYEDIVRVSNVFELSRGIYDLPMLGAEKLDVMYQLDLLEDRSIRELNNIEGPFLITRHGIVNILEAFNKWSYKANEQGKLELYDNVKCEFVDFSQEGYQGFLYPADSLGNVEFVFRRENIEKFEKEILKNDDNPLNLDESLLLIGSILNALKKAETPSRRWTQEALKAEMLDKGLKLSSRLLDEYFSSANKSYKSES